VFTGALSYVVLIGLALWLAQRIAIRRGALPPSAR
jgi:hypothetical protein